MSAEVNTVAQPQVAATTPNNKTRVERVPARVRMASPFEIISDEILEKGAEG